MATELDRIIQDSPHLVSLADKARWLAQYLRQSITKYRHERAEHARLIRPLPQEVLDLNPHLLKSIGEQAEQTRRMRDMHCECCRDGLNQLREFTVQCYRELPETMGGMKHLRMVVSSRIDDDSDIEPLFEEMGLIEHAAMAKAAQVGTGTPPTPAPAVDGKQGDKPITEDSAMLSPADLARTFNVAPDNLRKRLERYRKNNSAGWMEVVNRRQDEAQYLYSVSVARLIAENMASSETSSERPAK